MTNESLLQVVDGKPVYVVDLFPVPELPITDGGIPELKHYAKALHSAIENGIITEPGQYGIEIKESKETFDYTIYKIDNPEE